MSEGEQDKPQTKVPPWLLYVMIGMGGGGVSNQAINLIAGGDQVSAEEVRVIIREELERERLLQEAELKDIYRRIDRLERGSM